MKTGSNTQLGGVASDELAEAQTELSEARRALKEKDAQIRAMEQQLVGESAASDRTSTGFLRDRSSFTSFTRRDQRTARKRATETHAPMAEGPLAWLHPFDSGLHSFPSLDAGTDLLGLPPSNCGVAAKMAFSES